MHEDEMQFEILNVDDGVVASAVGLAQARYACETLLTSEEDRDAGYTRLQILDLRSGRIVEVAQLDASGVFYFQTSGHSHAFA